MRTLLPSGPADGCGRLSDRPKPHEIACQPGEAGHCELPITTVTEAALRLKIGKSRLYEMLRSDPRFAGTYFRWGRSYRTHLGRLLAAVERGEDRA